jgi:hypothetical protein
LHYKVFIFSRGSDNLPTEIEYYQQQKDIKEERLRRFALPWPKKEDQEKVRIELLAKIVDVEGNEIRFVLIFYEVVIRKVTRHRSVTSYLPDYYFIEYQYKSNF